MKVETHSVRRNRLRVAPLLGAAVAAAVLALFAAGSAPAIVGGSPDGNGHPNVAAVVYISSSAARGS